MAPATFSASRFLSDIRRYGATYMNYVGKPLAYILATPQQPDDHDNPLRIAFGRSFGPMTTSATRAMIAISIQPMSSIARSFPARRGRGAAAARQNQPLAAFLFSLADTVEEVAAEVGMSVRGGDRIELDGRTYTLEANDGPNHLHGGNEGLDKLHWALEATDSGHPASAVFRVTSPDGAGGYPGTLSVTATYRLDDSGTLTIAYEATTDKTTIVNITNHAYFNLGGAANGRGILGHELMIPASHITPVDETLIPTGELAAVEGTPFDFRTPRRIGKDIRDASSAQLRYGLGYDHNFVLDGADGSLRRAAVLSDRVSGRVMELLTTSPAVQFYSGNFLDGRTVGKGETLYRQADALCLEPQVYPDAPNKPGFPSARLEPGDRYSNVIVLRFSTNRAGNR